MKFIPSSTKYDIEVMVINVWSLLEYNILEYCSLTYISKYETLSITHYKTICR